MAQHITAVDSPVRNQSTRTCAGMQQGALACGWKAARASRLNQGTRSLDNIVQTNSVNCGQRGTNETLKMTWPKHIGIRAESK
ncbi:hypothetical protein L484_028008 [Morus notabilis]|uniref:Uncharacterized protein n=1 Tax=Morus notabilis TaxID=981085 RepID=W9SIA0_9ROSA|nr:hypothetical protein L484_028008 [Morus notabilis]